MHAKIEKKNNIGTINVLFAIISYFFSNLWHTVFNDNRIYIFIYYLYLSPVQTLKFLYVI